MPHSTEQKIKLLVVVDILKQSTDEEHFITTQEIIVVLEHHRISVSRKALYADTETHRTHKVPPSLCIPAE